MAKRFADTRLSREAWYRKLDPVQKAAWRFLTDECDQAGVWEVDHESIAFHVGADVDFVAFMEAVNADREEGQKPRIIWLDSTKILLTGFISFQYGTLSEECKPHRPVIERLKKLNLWKGYSKGFETLEEKEKDKDKEKEMKKGGPGENNSRRPQDGYSPEFEEFWKSYPRRADKSDAFRAFLKFVSVPKDLPDLMQATKNFSEAMAQEARQAKHIKHAATYLGSGRWRDWINPEANDGHSGNDSDYEAWAKAKRAELSGKGTP